MPTVDEINKQIAYLQQERQQAIDAGADQIVVDYIEQQIVDVEKDLILLENKPDKDTKCVVCNGGEIRYGLNNDCADCGGEMVDGQAVGNGEGVLEGLNCYPRHPDGHIDAGKIYSLTGGLIYGR